MTRNHSIEAGMPWSIESDPAKTNSMRTVRGVAAVVVLVTTILAFSAANAAASKSLIDSFGNPTTAGGTTGGLFAASGNGVGGVAVNETTGDIYTVDRGNQRVQQFSSTGAFIRAWGQDVIQPGTANNGDERQAVRVSATAGTFRLTYGADTTADIAYDASASAVQAALNALPALNAGGGRVTVSGGVGSASGNTPYLVTFTGPPLTGTDVPQMTAANGSVALSGGGATAAVNTFTIGAGVAAQATEICDTTTTPANAASDCKIGLATGNQGAALALPQGIALNQTTGNVYINNQFLQRIEEFDGKGNFLRAFGQDVVLSGPDNNGTGYEICTAADVCKTGIAGAPAGQGGAFAATFLGYPAVVPAGAPNAGNVIVPDPGNHRIQEFTSTGTFVRTWGFDVVTSGKPNDNGTGFEVCDVTNPVTPNVASDCKTGSIGSGVGQFGGTAAASYGPSRVAVDTTGAVYAVESLATNFRVQKFTPSGSTLVPSTFSAGVLSGTATTDTPTDVAVDRTNNDVYVIKAFPAGTGTPAAAVAERRLLQLNSAGALLDTHMVGTGLNSVNGLAINSTLGRLYISSGLVTPAVAQRIHTIDNVNLPTASVGAASDVSPRAATINGVVNSHGGAETSYHFEYGTDGVTWTSLPVADVSIGSGNSDVAVSQKITGLTPDTEYRFRIVATKAFGEGSVTTSQATFTTQQPVPELSTPTTGRLVPNGSSVLVRAAIDPNYSPTTYHVDYGTTIAYGSRVPVTDEAVTGGGSRVTVERLLTGLEAGVTYHFRFVATNAFGTTNSSDVLFTIPAGSRPDGRGYELVSPADSLAYDVLPPVVDARTQVSGSANARISTASGSAITYPLVTNGTLPGMVTDGDQGDPLVSTRGDGGWTWRAPLADRTSCPFAYGSSVAASDLAVDGQSLLLSVLCPQDKAVLSGTDPDSGQAYDQTGGVGVGVNASLFRVPLATDKPEYVTGAYSVTGRSPLTGNREQYYAGGSPDLATTYFTSNAGLVPEADVPTTSFTYLYRHTAAGTTLLSKRWDGTRFRADLSTNRTNAVSADGSRITVGVGGNATAALNGNMVAGDTNAVADVYQINGDVVTWLSNTEFTGAAQTPAARTFQGASANGDIAYFSTTEKMVGNGSSTGDLDTSTDIYRYVADAAPGAHLSLVTAADPSCALVPGTCTPNANGGGISNTSNAKFVGLSDDGTHAYFITGDVLNPADTDSQQSLYVRDTVAGNTTYIAPAGAGVTSTTDGTDAGMAGAGSLANSIPRLRAIRISNDGNAAAFLLASNVTLPAGRGGNDQDNTRDLYVWRVDDGLRRVQQGTAADANTTTVPSLGCITQTYIGLNQPFPTCRGLSDDGSKVFFETPDALTSDDHNTTIDVYVYNTNTAKLDLISVGDAPVDSRYADSDGAGDNVFFYTGETLDPSRDTDGGHFDMYVSRVGGGLPPLPDPDKDVCDPLRDPGGCQPPAQEDPLLPSPGVPDPFGPPPADEPSLVVSTVSAAAKKTFASTGKLTLTVKTSGGGTVTARATAPLSKKTVQVAKTTKTVTGGTSKLTITLSKAAKAELKRTRKLRVSIAVTYSKFAPVRTVLVSLTTPKPAKKSVAKKKSVSKKRATATSTQRPAR